MTVLEWFGWLLACYLVGMKLGKEIHAKLAIYSCDSCGSKVHHLALKKLNYGYDDVVPMKVCEECMKIRFAEALVKKRNTVMR